jgi:RNA polymerase sigma-70 factor (ECF subfamily)
VDPDLPLMQALQRGDDSVLNTLMDRHRESLFYFAYRYLRNETAANDVVQETFVRLYFKVAKFKPSATVKTWLYTIALNLCRDQIRRSHTWREARTLDAASGETIDATAKLRDPNAAPDIAAEKRDHYRLLQQAIDQLSPALREAIILFSLEGKSQKEAADILGTSPKTVELRIYHAKQKLKTLLENLFKPPSESPAGQ